MPLKTNHTKRKLLKKRNKFYNSSVQAYFVTLQRFAIHFLWMKMLSKQCPCSRNKRMVAGVGAPQALHYIVDMIV